MKAIYNGILLAESTETKVIEGNHYFPPDSIFREFFEESDLHTTCQWKGVASYYHIVVDGKRLENAAWYYPEPSERASAIRNHVAFYTNKVEISE